jgi:peptidyl-prolyl cis-trans isomerase SurA
MARMEPAIRSYLTTMREQAFVEVKPGYTDTGASAKQTKPIYSAYTPPAPKKKKKVERTRFRENTRTFRQKTPQAAEPAEAPAAVPVANAKGKKNSSADAASMKPGKREKIRLGQAPTKTLPHAPEAATEDAGAVDHPAATPEPVNPLEVSSKPTEKTRFSARPKEVKQGKAKAKGAKADSMAPAAPDSAEVADQQTQAGPLGLAGDTAAKKKKKAATTTGDKTRLTDKKKKAETPADNSGDAPLATAPAPAPAPK